MTARKPWRNRMEKFRQCERPNNVGVKKPADCLIAALRGDDLLLDDLAKLPQVQVPPAKKKAR
jgi:hypothetical protein